MYSYEIEKQAAAAQMQGAAGSLARGAVFGDAIAQAPEPEISVQLSRLGSAVGRLEGAHKRLRDRLQGVILPVPPRVAGNGGEKLKGPMSPLGDVLSSRVAELERLADEVSTLTDSLAV